MSIKQSNLKFNKAFFRDLWCLLKPYWSSEEKYGACILLAITIACVFGEVFANVGFNHFHKIFFDALQHFDKPGLVASLEYVLVVSLFSIACIVGYTYFNNLLSIRWRRWLTKNYIAKWLNKHNHHHIRILNPEIDNPDQRISEDLEKFPTATLTLFLGPFKILHSILQVSMFGYILWDLSHYFIFSVGSWHGYIPGYLFWVVFLYASIGTWLISRLGKKLPQLNYQQQHYAADFRFSLVRMREASEQISLYRGEPIEQGLFSGLFDRIFGNFLNIISLKARLTGFQKVYAYLSYYTGLMISIPFYLAKAFQLGTMMQISSAYNSVEGGFSAFLESFSEFSDWRSVVHRLAELTRAIEKLDQSHASKILMTEHADHVVKVKNLKLELPTGQSLLPEINLSLTAGQRLLITGPTGIGKSTFLRALAGLWFYGEGQIHLPEQAKLLFLPQKPYLPLGSMKDLLLYPQQVTIDDQSIIDVMTLCHLEKFKSEINEVKNWAHELSLGEQQLIAFARIFLCKPAVIFLDEATSALDEKTECYLHEQLRIRLPHAIVLSIGHRHSLRDFHERVIDFAKNETSVESDFSLAE